LDFLGVNYCSDGHPARPDVLLDQASQVHPVETNTPDGRLPAGHPSWSRIWDQYHPAKLFITENGVPVPDGIDFDGRVRDYRRIRYLRDHLSQVHRAIQAGVPLRGYLVWSLLDNFEWALGYQMRFGLIHVDFETQARTIKESGRWYAQVIRENGLDPEQAVPGG
jgi:beta-glucosidase